MPKGCVTQHLACDKHYSGELKSWLMEYKEVFLMELPKRIPFNRGLGDEIEIKLAPGTDPIW